MDWILKLSSPYQEIPTNNSSKQILHTKSDSYGWESTELLALLGISWTNQTICLGSG